MTVSSQKVQGADPNTGGVIVVTVSSQKVQGADPKTGGVIMLNRG